MGSYPRRVAAASQSCCANLAPRGEYPKAADSSETHFTPTHSATMLRVPPTGAPHTRIQRKYSPLPPGSVWSPAFTTRDEGSVCLRHGRNEWESVCPRVSEARGRPAAR